MSTIIVKLCQSISLALLVAGNLSLPALAIEESDVTFFAPFEESTSAKNTEGRPDPKISGQPVFGPGIRGHALELDAASLLTYAFRRNVIPEEGTIMMWAKPEWPMNDKKFHFFFRASTGNHGGKALNALMLYKYLRDARLLFYTSNGQKTSASEGRTLTSRANIQWPVGEWRHLAVTWSSTIAATEMWIYTNGKRMAASRSAIFVPDDIPATFDLGGPIGAGTTWLDDVLVFNRPLTPPEIAGLVQSYQKGLVAEAGELPFLPSRDVQIQPHVNFRAHKLIIVVDYRAGRKDLGGKSGRLAVRVDGGQGTVQKEVKAALVGVAKVAMDYDQVKPGEKQIRVALMNREGKALRQSKTTYTVPEKPVWLDNDLGKSDKVFPPWTSLKVRDGTVKMWGREYTLEKSPLPSRIRSKGRPLLRGPVQLSLSQGESKKMLRMQPVGGFKNTGAAASRNWKGQLGPLECSATTRIEYDGFMRLDLEMRPGSAAPVNGLELLVPLRGDSATLYHHADGSWSKLSEAGAIGKPGWKKPLPFVPYVWIGDEETGLSWVCEHNNNWHNADEDGAIEIARTAAGVDLRIRLIDSAVALEEPLRFTFGFLATPVKPLPHGWRDWQQTFISALDLNAFVKNSGAQPQFRNIGVLYNNHVGAFSYFPANPPEMKRKIAFLHENGWQTMVSYYALNFGQVGTPEFNMMEREWRRNPFSENRTGGKPPIGYASVCNESTSADFLVWVINQTMDETGTDGVYLDCSNPSFCRNSEHGCAPGKYPIFATRELQKRIYTLVKEKRGEKGFVYSHNSENNILTTFAFSDAVLNGEQYNKKDLRTLTREKFRAEFLPYSSGVPNFLLPTLTKRQKNRKEKMPGDEFLAFPFLHDVICVGAWLSPESCKFLKRTRLAMCEFGMADVTFIPYWNSKTELETDPPSIPVSAYLRKDGKAALLITQGDGNTQAFTVKLKGRLGPLLSAPLRPLLKEMPTPAWQAGTVHWPLNGRKVQMIVLGR